MNPPPYQVMPELTRDEYLALRADIEENGIAVPIIVDESGVIIDGHHRAEIADALGIDCPVEVVAGLSEAAKLDLALRVNINRRSLSREQKRDLLAKALKATPEQSNRQIAERTGVDHKTVGSVRDDLEGRGEIPHVAERTDSVGRAQPATRPAKVTQTTRTTESTKIEREIDEETGEILDSESSPYGSSAIKQNRSSLVDEFERALLTTSHAIKHLHKLTGDDRWKKNAARISERNQGDLDRLLTTFAEVVHKVKTN